MVAIASGESIPLQCYMASSTLLKSGSVIVIADWTSGSWLFHDECTQQQLYAWHIESVPSALLNIASV